MDPIVILERITVDPLIVNYVLRANVPVARQTFFADPSKDSAYRYASSGDLDDLRSGRVLERAGTHNFSGMTIVQMKAWLMAEQTSFQTDVTADGAQNPWKFYGVSFNGSVWSTGGTS